MEVQLSSNSHGDDIMWSPVEIAAGGARPCARGKHSATLLGGFIYVLGGRGAGGSVPLRDFWRYCLGSGTWERLQCRGEPPPALQEHSATAHEGSLYVFGGEAGALSTETPLWIYDTESQYWRKLASQPSYPSTVRRAPGRGPGGGAPRGRRGHSAHALRDCLLIYGGYMDLRGSTNELWAFHYESESWQQVRTSVAGPARHRHAAALHDAKLYVHAGACDLRHTADLWTYDTISRVWSQIRTPAKLSPSARSGHAAVRAGAHLYIFGGEVDGHPANDMWRFHFATETWQRICPTPNWPAPRVDACALLVSGGEGAAERGAAGGGAAPARAPAGILREISRLSSFHVRRAARCSYTVLGERDSTESLPRGEPLPKSRSAYGVRGASPAEGDVVEWRELPRDRASVPDFAAPRPTAAPDSEGEDSGTSGYASLAALGGFTNPHYLGGEVRADIELHELRPAAPAPAPALRVLLVGGREPPHVARLQAPLNMWTYRLL